MKLYPFAMQDLATGKVMPFRDSFVPEITTSVSGTCDMPEHTKVQKCKYFFESGHWLLITKTFEDDQIIDEEGYIDFDDDKGRRCFDDREVVITKWIVEDDLGNTFDITHKLDYWDDDEEEESMSYLGQGLDLYARGLLAKA